MRRLYVLLVSIVLATTLIAVASSAGASAAPTRQEEPFGALAFAPSVEQAAFDSYAFAFSKRAAKRSALANCQESASEFDYYRQDCQGAVWVRNGWMALAYERPAGAPPYTLAWGSDWGRTKDVALSHALGICQQNAGEECGNSHTRPTYPLDPNKPTRGGAW